MKILLLIVLSLTIFSQSEKQHSVGVFASVNIYGINTGYRLNKEFGFNLIGAKIIGFVRKNEYSYSIIASSTFYFPIELRNIDIGLSVASIYSNYHWDKNGKSGSINDINFGTGISTRYKISEQYQFGLNVLFVNAYNTKFNSNGNQYISSRKLLTFPAFNIDYLF